MKPILVGSPPFVIQGGLPSTAYKNAQQLRKALKLNWRQVTALAFMVSWGAYEAGSQKVRDKAEQLRALD